MELHLLAGVFTASGISALRGYGCGLKDWNGFGGPSRRALGPRIAVLVHPVRAYLIRWAPGNDATGDTEWV